MTFRISYPLVLVACVLSLALAGPGMIGLSRPRAVSDAGSTSMPMIEATAAESFTAKTQALAPTGWTATADSAAGGYPAANAIDAKPATMWHTAYVAPIPALPHTLTIDMHATRNIAGITYLPRQDASLNGTIGRYTVSTSLNGTTWGTPVATGTWASDNTIKTAVFRGTSARYVRLSALTEAGNRGQWTSAAEVGLLEGDLMPPAYSRTGWTATSSDQANSYPADNVLDGNADTMWHSNYVPNPDTPLPHSLTIDMKTARTVSALSYLPRQDAASNGNIGAFSVATSTNNINWNIVATGNWPDSKIAKTTRFAPTTARFVRLTATSEAGARGPWSSAAEINVHGTTPPAGVSGSWSAPVGLPLVPVSAVLLPGNKLLTFSAFHTMKFDKVTPMTQVAIMDLATGAVSEPSVINTGHQMFCTGLAIMSDGRVMINGGSNDSATTIYNPLTNVWTKGPLMNIPRAYQSSVTLSNGQVFTLGGSWYDSLGGKDGEVFVPSGTTGVWRRLTGVSATNILTADPAGVYRADNHSWLFAVSGGGVFHAGPSKQMNWITTTGNGSITSAGLRADSADAMNGNAVMYDTGKILTMGGATAYQDFKATAVNIQANQRSYVIDISRGQGAPVTTVRSGDMAYARAFANGVVLPDGKVLVVGGQQHPQGFTDTGAVLSPELWDPATGQFSIMAPALIPRTYHSVAVLLADGRVLSAGGGLCGTCTTNHPDAEIFTPPYLLNPDGSLRVRPVITSAPATATTGTSISVATTGATAPRFSLIRATATTHAVNTDQRRIPLVPTATSGNVSTLTLPADKGILIPGDYLLFVMDESGTPSIARMIRIN